MFKKFFDEDKKFVFELLKGWFLVEDCDVIIKSYKFLDFKDVFVFMMCCVFKVEEMNYYFEWFNVYNNVEVMFIMYDVGGFLEFDVVLVIFMDESVV